MLGSKVLPQGMGHTTCCFLSVEGGSENAKYFTEENGSDRFPIEELNDVGHALSKGNQPFLPVFFTFVFREQQTERDGARQHSKGRYYLSEEECSRVNWESIRKLVHATRISSQNVAC